MTMIERAVTDLADALDALETKIADKATSGNSGGALPATAARHVRTAGERADYAARELASVIDDLKAMIENDGES